MGRRNQSAEYQNCTLQPWFCWLRRAPDFFKRLAKIRSELKNLKFDDLPVSTWTGLLRSITWLKVATSHWVNMLSVTINRWVNCVICSGPRSLFQIWKGSKIETKNGLTFTKAAVAGAHRVSWCRGFCLDIWANLFRENIGSGTRWALSQISGCSRRQWVRGCLTENGVHHLGRVLARARCF